MEPLFHVKEQLGAWQIDGDQDQGRVQFRLFFPVGFETEISSIRVAGTFQKQLGGGDWNFQTGLLLSKTVQPEGNFWSCTTDSLHSGFYEYKYLVTFTNGENRIVSDPYARYGGTEYQNAAVVVGGSRPQDNVVMPLAQRKHLRDLVIYEMHLDDFTAEYRETRPPLEAVVDKLDYLVSLGINAILFMPWTAWKNRGFDWGYEPFQYFAVEYRYVNSLNQEAEKISWLKRMITACHQRGIHVILDGVFNHVSVDFPYEVFYLDRAKCPYTGTFGGTFSGLRDLDFNNSCTQDFIRDVCLYWIDSFKIDGIRFDNTVNYHRQSDEKGIPRLLGDIRSFVEERGEENFSLTLEHLDLSAARITNETDATSYWDNAFYEQCFHSLWWRQIGSGLLNACNNNRFLLSEQKVATIYLSNHDHSHVNWQAGARQNNGAFCWQRTRPFMIALLTGPGVPMIQNGQEFGEDHWIPEDDHGTGRRVLPRPLRWKQAGDPIGEELFFLYRRLIAIRHMYPAFRTCNFYPESQEEWQDLFNPQGYGVDRNRQLVIYHRWGNDAYGTLQRFIIVLNFSDTNQQVSAPFSENGIWTDLLSGWRPQVDDYQLSFEIGANWGHLFFI